MFPFNMLESFFRPEKAYEKAGQRSQQYYNQAQQHMQPYAQQGQAAHPYAFGAMQKLLNPMDLFNQWAQQYEMSDMAKLNRERARVAGLESASSQGLMGSSPALQAIQGGMYEAEAGDKERQFERLLNSYVTGSQLAQNLYGQGAQASNQLGQNAMNQGTTMAQIAHGQQSAPGQMFGQLLGTGASLAGSYMGMKGMNNMANAWKTAV